MTDTPIDLKARAHQAMLDAGFRPDFPPQAAEIRVAMSQHARLWGRSV